VLKGTLRLVIVSLAILLAGCDDNDKVVVSCDPQLTRISLGRLRETWTLASPPLAQPSGAEGLLPTRATDQGFSGLSDPAFKWFNPFPMFKESDIYSNTDPSEDRSTHILVLEFRPQESPTLQGETNSDAAWGGVMRALPLSAWDLSQAAFLEIRMAIESPAKWPGTMHIDLGRISEDVNSDGVLNTEDLKDEFGIRNRILDDGEDVGLDRLPDSMEVSPDGTPYDLLTNPDPAHDNWPAGINNQAELVLHDRINGTENNSPDPTRGLRPDSEDIGGPFEFDRVNAYHEYTIRLDDTEPSFVPFSDKLSEDRTGLADVLVWATYRIPLWSSDSYTQFFEDIRPGRRTNQFARVWFTGARGTVRVYIAKMAVLTLTPE
jgi:cell surface protein SprA